MSDHRFEPRRFVMAQYADPETLLKGTTEVREKGHKKVDTHTPYPLHGLEEALGLGRPKIPYIVLGGAIAGIFAAVSMMYYMNVYDWEINVGGRTALALPAWLPITFELAVLLGGCSSFFGVLALMRFPEPYHPVFQWDHFVDNSVDGFFLSVELSKDDDSATVAELIKGTGATAVEVIEEVER